MNAPRRHPQVGSTQGGGPRRARIFGAFAGAVSSDSKGASAPASRLALALAATCLAALIFGASLASAAAPAVTIEDASPVGYLSAGVKGSVDPEGEATTYRFQYATQADFSDAVTGIEIGGLEGAGAQPVSGELTGLQQNTTYHLRLLAENASDPGPPAEAVAASTFTTKAVAKPTLTIAAAGSVSYQSAKASGTVELAQNDPAFNSSCVFEYATEADFSNAVQVACTPETILASAAQPVSVTADLSGLIANTTYHLRLAATNSGGHSEAAAAPFTTPAEVPAIDQTFATGVTATEAVLGGQINPRGAATTYHYEYGTTTSYGTKAPVPDAALGSDDTDHATAPATLTGLEPSTVYHYRLVATNSKSPAGGTLGPDRTFTTQSAAAAPPLPDGRQWELVSPPEKDGAQIYGITAENTVVLGGSTAVQAAADGSAITYTASAPVGSEPAGNAAASQVLSKRGAGGWASQDISPANPGPVNLRFELGEPFRLFSPDLSQGVLQENPDSPSQQAIVLRDNATGVSQTLATPGHPFSFEAATPDLSHLLLVAATSLGANLYEWSAGQLAQVNILEGGAEAPGSFGGNEGPFHEIASDFVGRHAISDDGNRIVWGTETALYSRDMATGKTIQLDTGPAGSGLGVFQLASADGTRVFFTDSTPLTAGATPGSLYLFDLTTEHLTDLGPTGAVLGANEAATAVYVTSTEKLTEEPNPEGEKAIEGGSNIYLLREASPGTWTTSFIAILSAVDATAYNGEAGGSIPHHLIHLPVRVSPNGRWFAFMSNASLTGYDNRDAVSGQPDEEVFLYGAAENGAEASLACASCNPTGARPLGELDTGTYPGSPMDPTRTWGNGKTGEDLRTQWLAAAIPGWNEAIHGVYLFNNNSPHDAPLYASRVLSDSGRLFFDSADGLVPQDTNGSVDVYEYEPNGEGSCASAPACLALISSGQGKGDSEFVDASASGDDVFFTTPQRLVPADFDGSSDMYEAHVCTGEFPCLSQSAIASPPCTSNDSCLPSQTPQPGSFGAPPSATFTGPGNEKQKSKHHKHKKHHKKKHAKRASHNGGGGK